MKGIIMRQLTITRNKSFVACLGTYKVYIEDQFCCEQIINNIPCRKLGELKNGGTLSVVIPDNPAKVFVIADTLSKGYCNDFYNLPAGDQDIFLTGKAKYSPSAGNPFRFDGVTDPEVLEARKKSGKKSWIVLICALVVGFIIGFAIVGSSLFSALFGAGEPTTFTCEEMSITLPGDFDKYYDKGDFDFLIANEDIGVAGFYEEKSVADNARDYLSKVMTANSLSFADVVSKDGLVYVEYTDTVDGVVYKYVGYAFEGSENFWFVQFNVAEKDYDEYRDDITEWAKTVKVD